jgi:hypothetical protein
VTASEPSTMVQHPQTLTSPVIFCCGRRCTCPTAHATTVPLQAAGKPPRVSRRFFRWRGRVGDAPPSLLAFPPSVLAMSSASVPCAAGWCNRCMYIPWQRRASSAHPRRQSGACTWLTPPSILCMYMAHSTVNLAHAHGFTRPSLRLPSLPLGAFPRCSTVGVTI